jgi:CRISPR-associated RAMP protein (TIGR02581 family)
VTTEPIASFAALRNRLRIGGTLVALTALRIGAGRSSDVSGTDLPVLRDALKRPFIPGASLKGALRARMEALVRAVQPQEALDLGEIEVWQRKKIAPLKEDPDLKGDDRQLSRAIWQHSTLIDLTFGAQWTASRVFVKDALVDPQLWFGQFEVRNGVGIERDTETASDGKLYDYEVVPAGTRFAFELVMENAADWQLGMLLLALRPWERGEAQIGGFRSRGLGYVRLEEASCHFTQLTDVDALLDLLDGKDRGEVTDEQRQAWRDAFRAALIDHDQARQEVCEC